MIRILHVEDDSDDHILLCRRMEKLAEGELEIVWADHPERALDQIAGEHFDCILCDYHLPGMDGLSLLQNLKGLGNGHLSDTAFILYTTDDDERIKARAMDIGVDGYHVKDAPAAAFSAILHNIVDAVSRCRPARETD